MAVEVQKPPWGPPILVEYSNCRSTHKSDSLCSQGLQESDATFAKQQGNLHPLEN
jgi:hypothetical protein